MPKIHLRTASACGKVIAAARDRMPGDPDEPLEFLNEDEYQHSRVDSLEVGLWSWHLAWMCDDCPVVEIDTPGHEKTLLIFPESCAKVLYTPAAGNTVIG